METNREQGNALIYILIAIALFAALSMTLGRQSGSNEANDLSNDKAELYATQIASYAAQAKSATDQMVFSRTSIGNFEFSRPGDADFEIGTPIDKTRRVYHPDGGGLSVGTLPPEAMDKTLTNPTAGWFMGRFNNVDWTASIGTDVILVAYGIHKKICEHINKNITGDVAIPELDDSIADIMIDDAYHTGTNEDFTTDPTGTPICAECRKQTTLCVKSNGADIYGFYTILQDR